MAVTNVGSYDAWQRRASITIDDGTYQVDMHVLTETIDLDIGERDIDIINLVNLGQIPKHGAMGITTITFEGYALNAGTSSATGSDAEGFFDIFAYRPTRTLTSGSDADSAEPQDHVITNELTRYRVAILWSNETALEGDGAVTGGATYQGKRFILADCFCTACKQSFTDGILKTTLTFKGTAFSKAGSARIQMESVSLADTGALPAPTAYTAGSVPW